jgi:hypothetical protein
VHLEARYLLPESIAQIERLLKSRPFLGSALLLGVFAAVLGLLRRLFGKVTTDLVVFALILYALILVAGSAIYTLTHVKGFHFGG